jgi:hypothetical protein
MLLECSGSHYDMGFKQGLSLKTSIKEAFDIFFEFEPIKNIRPFYMSSSLVAEAAGVIAYNFLMKKLEDFDHDTYNRLKGISDGSGLHLNLFLFVQFFESLISTPFMTIPGCTGAIIDSSRTILRRSLMIKNYDLFTFLPMTTCVRKSSPLKRLKSIELNITPLAGCHIGINEAGLAISYNYGVERTHYKKNLPPTIICQYVLENFARTRQAVEFIRDNGVSNGAIFFIFDEASEGIVLEALGKSTAIRNMKNGIISASNMFLHPDMIKYNYRDTDRYDNNLSPSHYHGMLVNTSNNARYMRINELLTRRPSCRFSERHLKLILRDHNGEKEGNDNTICRHDEVISTLASIILDIKKRRMDIAFGEPCMNRYETYRL